MKLEIEKSLTLLENSREGNFEVKVSSQREHTQQITENYAERAVREALL